MKCVNEAKHLGTVMSELKKWTLPVCYGLTLARFKRLKTTGKVPIVKFEWFNLNRYRVIIEYRSIFNFQYKLF